MKFANICFINLVINFKLDVFDEYDWIPILKGEYDDFTVEWYKNVAVPITVTIITESVVPYLSKIIMAIFKSFLRCYDRKYKCSPQANGDK